MSDTSTHDDRRAQRLLMVALAWLAAGLLAHLVAPAAAQGIMLAGLLLCSVPMLVVAVRSLAKGNVNVDLIASLAIITAIATNSPLPGLIIVIMQNGGEMLEQAARGRATDTVRALEQDVPRTAHRLSADGLSAEELDVAAIQPGDLLLLRPGELVPCDALVIEGRSHVNTARITGESTPKRVTTGAQLWSGMLNVEGALTLRATATAGESQYAQLVELVRFGQASKAPLQRLADRAAGWFTPLTLAACAVTWFVTRDMSRVLAVLVVATPCPLLLATPIAIMGGVDRAAGRRIVFRTGGALERLSSASAAVFDKTGTITIGEPRVDAVTSFGPFAGNDLLSMAAALEAQSSHALARSVVQHAKDLGLGIAKVTEVREHAGEGVEGTVGTHHISIGSMAFSGARATLAARPAMDHSELRAEIVVDGIHAGEIRFADQLRPEIPEVLGSLTALGLHRTLLLSGDAKDHTARIATLAGIADAHGELLPGQKVEWIETLQAEGERVLMVGDGVNDAPALVAASVGIAIAPRQGGLAANSADIVLLRDDLRSIPEAIRISRHTMRVARQCIGIGLGLSMGAMVFAAFGMLPALEGAILQEFIDVAVILNALRSRGAGGLSPRRAATSNAGGMPQPVLSH